MFKYTQSKRVYYKYIERLSVARLSKVQGRVAIKIQASDKRERERVRENAGESLVDDVSADKTLSKPMKKASTLLLPQGCAKISYSTSSQGSLNHTPIHSTFYFFIKYTLNLQCVSDSNYVIIQLSRSISLRKKYFFYLLENVLLKYTVPFYSFDKSKSFRNTTQKNSSRFFTMHCKLDDISL